MAERLTKSAARNIFYGGSIFFLAIFALLTAHSHYYIVNVSTDESTSTEAVARGKHGSVIPALIVIRCWVRGFISLLN